MFIRSSLALVLVTLSLVACSSSGDSESVGTDEGAVTAEVPVGDPVPGGEPAPTAPPASEEPTFGPGTTVSAGQCAGTLNQNQARNCTMRGQTFSASIVCSRCPRSSANITVTCTGPGAFTAPTQAALKTACGG